MKVGGLHVVDNYEEVDRENVKKYRSQEPYDERRYAYHCVVCGRQACISGSCSDQGHKLICVWCARANFPDGELGAVKWCSEAD